jgi:hypothetical protein
VERVQVKGSSKPESNNLYPLEADRVFGRLNGQVAAHSVVLTNRPLGPGLRDRCSQSVDTDEYEHWTHYSVGVGQNCGDDGRIVTKLLLDEVFRSATADGPSRFEALDIIKFVSTPDPEIDHAVGRFDWGIPVTGIPTLPPTVPRLDLLD